MGGERKIIERSSGRQTIATGVALEDCMLLGSKRPEESLTGEKCKERNFIIELTVN